MLVVQPYPANFGAARPLHAGPIQVAPSNPIYGQSALRASPQVVGRTPQNYASPGVQVVVQRPGGVVLPQQRTDAMVNKVNQQAIIDKISAILDDRDALKESVEECFESVANGEASLNMLGLMRFKGVVAKKLDVTESIFRNLNDDYVRFDFNGDNTLQEHEAYSMVKHQLRKYRKSLGYEIDAVNVPNKSLVAEGYRLVRQLGKGAQGSADLYNHISSGEQFCIKSLPKSDQNALLLDELKDEYRILHNLHNTRVQKIFDIFQDPMTFFLVNEPYFGDDFSKLRTKALAQGVLMTEDWWKLIFRQCFEGLAYLHKHAIMHCDIKEANMMLKQEDVHNPDVVIVDFGVAQYFVHPKYDQLRGTPGYLPPETWKQHKWFPKGDAFSMGVCMAQLVLDSIPEETPMGVRGGIFTDGARSIEDVERFTATRVPQLQGLPSSMAALVKRLLDKTMKARDAAPQALKHPFFNGGEAGDSSKSSPRLHAPVAPVVVKSSTETPTIVSSSVAKANSPSVSVQNGVANKAGLGRGPRVIKQNIGSGGIKKNMGNAAVFRPAVKINGTDGLRSPAPITRSKPWTNVNVYRFP